MSDQEEDRSLLANIEDDPSLDDTQSAAMQQMMGFSSFGGPQKPKRQPRGPPPAKGIGFGTGANSQPIHQRSNQASSKIPRGSTSAATSTSQPKPNSKPLSATSHPFVPASLPPPSQSVGPPHQTSTSQTSLPDPTSAPTQPTAFPPTAIHTFNPMIATASPSTTTTNLTTTSSHQPSNTTTTPNLAFTNPSSTTEIGYTNPTTNISLTRAELHAYERGVLTESTMADGTPCQVKVYFKPSFVDDDPWRGLGGRA